MTAMITLTSKSRIEAMIAAQGVTMQNTCAGLNTRLAAVETALPNKSAVGHTHAYADLTGKPNIPVIVQHPYVAPITATAATNASTNAPTNLTALSILSNEMNTTNQKQNDMGAIVNAHGTMLNAVKALLNAVLSTLQANGMRVATP